MLASWLASSRLKKLSLTNWVTLRNPTDAHVPFHTVELPAGDGEVVSVPEHARNSTVKFIRILFKLVIRLLLSPFNLLRFRGVYLCVGLTIRFPTLARRITSREEDMRLQTIIGRKPGNKIFDWRRSRGEYVPLSFDTFTWTSGALFKANVIKGYYVNDFTNRLRTNR